MITPKRAREASILLFPSVDDPAFPDVGDPTRANFEEKLDVNNIQGNVVPGFNKDFQTLLVLEIDKKHVDDFKRWLKTQVPFISTAAEVIAFNRLFKAIRSRRGTETKAVQSTWVNIAFSHAGIKKLAKPADLQPDFVDKAFVAGLDRRAEDDILGDPIKNKKAEGNPKNWVIGGPNSDPADVIFIVASD